MNALTVTRVILFGSVVLAFPVAAMLVFGFSYDRSIVANGLSVVYAFGLFLAMFACFYPFKCTSDWSRLRRVESLVLVYLGMSYFTHLSWEFAWLIAHESIARNPDAIWAYSWWAYIDGGDARYADPDSNLLVMEFLSVCNGIVGMYALTRFLKSSRTDKVAVMIMMGTAVVHLYSASLYYFTEIFFGMPNVNTDSFIATWIKFGMANSPWVIVPWFVFWWGQQKILGETGETS